MCSIHTTHQWGIKIKQKNAVSNTSCVVWFKDVAEGEKSSNSAAFSLARVTTLSGKFANSATWIPKLWSQAPGSTYKLKHVKKEWVDANADFYLTTLL